MSLRRPGSPWRLLVHDWPGTRAGLRYGRSHHVTNDERVRPESGWCDTTVLAGAEFDELVVGRWLHIEAMDATTWWMDVGGITVHVTADRDGRPKRVTVRNEDPVPGCVYEIDGDPS